MAQPTQEPERRPPEQHPSPMKRGLWTGVGIGTGIAAAVLILLLIAAIVCFAVMGPRGCMMMGGGEMMDGRMMNPSMMTDGAGSPADNPG